MFFFFNNTVSTGFSDKTTVSLLIKKEYLYLAKLVFFPLGFEYYFDNFLKIFQLAGNLLMKKIQPA
jgi:hypothetical protein